MRTILFLLVSFPAIFSFSLEGIASSALDFVPGVGNLKSIGEAISGKDLITGEKLSKFERALSLIGAIPGGNYLKNTKYLKNGQKFFKAGERAKKLEKIKNAINFAKAGERAMTKAYRVPKMISNAFKGAKAFFKGSRD